MTNKMMRNISWGLGLLGFIAAMIICGICYGFDSEMLLNASARSVTYQWYQDCWLIAFIGFFYGMGIETAMNLTETK